MNTNPLMLAMNPHRLLAAPMLAAALLVPLAWAGPGHDHDHDHGASAAPAGPALPRFTAVSETFEMVGVLEGRRLVLYVDRTPDNTPVVGATIELEVAGAKLPVEMHDDTYDALLPAEPKPGVLPITATVTAGSDIDLLAGDLEIAAPVAEEDHAHGPDWRSIIVWTGGAVVALALLLVLARRLLPGRRAATGASV